jgi:hypothetical protein
MKTSKLMSIVFSAFLLGGVAVLLIIREPSVALVFLAIGILGQLVSKVLQARQKAFTSGEKSDSKCSKCD